MCTAFAEQELLDASKRALEVLKNCQSFMEGPGMTDELDSIVSLERAIRETERAISHSPC